MGKADTKSAHRDNRNICLPFSQEVYHANINNAPDFRKCIDERIELFPELFPPEITKGYRMKDSRLLSCDVCLCDCGSQDICPSDCLDQRPDQS